MDKSKPFGLIIPKRAQKFQANRSSVFNSDSDDDQPPKKTCPIPQAKPAKIVKEQKIEDPSIYEYDSVYDDMKAEEVAQLQPKDNKPSRYIETLLKAADKRKKEYERRVERKVQLDREKEGDEFKDKEAFVTSAYKKKMQELEEEEERERRENQLNEMMDVTKQKDLSGFYRHFLKQSVGEEKIPVFGEKKLEIKEEPKSGSDEEQINKPPTTHAQVNDDLDENIDRDSEIESSESEEEDSVSKVKETEQFKSKTSRNKKTNLRRRDSSSGSDSSEKSSDETEKPIEKSSVEVERSNEKSSAQKEEDKNSSNSMNGSASGKPEVILPNSSSASKTVREVTDEDSSDSDSSNDDEDDNSSDSDQSDSENSSTNKKKVSFAKDEKKNEPKIDIYAKRTFGDAFAAAQARYFQRMAKRSC